jgi:hypothetical protein
MDVGIEGCVRSESVEGTYRDAMAWPIKNNVVP